MNMLERGVPMDTVPFFWTRFYDKSLHYTGIGATKYDDIHIEGNLKDLKFLVYYFWNNRVVGAASMNMP